MNADLKTTDLSTLAGQLPPVVALNKIDRYWGGLISKGYLANRDSQGLGPRRIRLGGRIGYLREDLIAWLEGRANTDIPPLLWTHS